ncbi:MAG TPA: glycosyltransferase family 2 protein [Stellaceae bacterium]|jgi:glycosyltransferase involved in cell wall biosynthesis|nr:glycosyltransferase family 2 protein [Stellaceae bacterium]
MIETSVVIPTYHRPVLLARAVDSVLAQQGDVGNFEIVVVDNDAAGSAEAAVAAMAQASRVPIRYVRECRPGISHARNTGVVAATGRYLAFLDDDEAASPGWLAGCLATIRASGAAAVVGPIRPLFPEDADVNPYCRKVYTRDANVPTGTLLAKWTAIGNTLLDKARCFTSDEPFDPRLGLSGGEDTVFLRRLMRGGGTVAWCAEAVVNEVIPIAKLAPNYLLRRAFRGGQTTTFVCVEVTPSEWGQAAFWMAVGGAQVVLYTPVALLFRALKRERWLSLMVKAVGGLGKVCWHPNIHLKLYH